MRPEKFVLGFCIASMQFTSASLAQSVAVTLGSSVADLKSIYGEPVQDFGTVLKFESCQGSESEAKWAFVFVSPLPDATDAEKAVGGKLTGVQRYACDSQRLSETLVKDEAGNMLPADARPVREFMTDDGRKAWEFHSQLLASKFAPGDFLGCDAQGRMTPVTPGTVSYTMAIDGSSWFMGMGTCL